MAKANRGVRLTASRPMPDLDLAADLAQVDAVRAAAPNPYGRLEFLPLAVRHHFNDQMCLLLQLEIPVTAELMDKMVDLAVLEYQRDQPVPHGRGRHEPVVYYMRLSGLVKIGTTVNIAKRIGGVMSQGVMAVEFGSFPLEGERHRQFAHLRESGEWFRLESDLGAHIADVRAAFEVSTGESTEDWVTRFRRGDAREVVEDQV